MEWERVAAVTGAGGPGSGYVVAPRLVLTSAHVAGVVGALVTVYRPGRVGTFAGTVVWCGTPAGRDDAALVQVNDPTWVPVETGRVWWGRSVTYRPGIKCECWGMPDLVQRPDRAIEVQQLTGVLNPGDRLVGDRYVMNLDGHPPVGTSPWGGLSGAAMFCGELLAGVITAEPANRAHAALEAVPVSLLMRDSAFVDVVAAHVGVPWMECEAIELQPLVDGQARVAAGGPVASPAGLLPARQAVVPFHGREELLLEMEAWAGSPGVGVWLLHGPGGQGKTRLAHQFGENRAATGWALLWLAQTISASELRVLADVRVPTLVVVDYAEGRAEQLAALAVVLSRRTSSIQLKVLLLARTADAWWTQLPAAGEALTDLVDTAQVVQLDVLDDTDTGRCASYETAIAAFSAAAGRIVSVDQAVWVAAAAAIAERPMPDFRGRTVLAVHMTALADLLDVMTGADSPQPSTTGVVRGPEDRLLDHERRYWATTATAHGLFPGVTATMLDDVVTAATLLGPSSLEDLDEQLTRMPALADMPRARRDALRGWLLQVYPSGEDRRFEGLTPDRLAERLTGRLLLDHTKPCIIDYPSPPPRATWKRNGS